MRTDSSQRGANNESSRGVSLHLIAVSILFATFGAAVDEDFAYFFKRQPLYVLHETVLLFNPVRLLWMLNWTTEVPRSPPNGKGKNLEHCSTWTKYRFLSLFSVIDFRFEITTGEVSETITAYVAASRALCRL